MTAPDRERILNVLWLIAWGAASSVWCITAAAQLSATFDEPLYITGGLEAWRSGSHRGLLTSGTMPLAVDVYTFPLHLWERGRGTAFGSPADLPQLLPWARAGALVFWWLLLVYGWRVGRQLTGPWGGRLAVAVLACEPSLLAHAALATTDIAVSACLLALLYHFRSGRDAGWTRRVGIPALWFAAAVLAKASGLALGVIGLVAVEYDRLRAATVPTRRRDLFQIVGYGLILVIVYCGTDWQQQPSFVAWAQGLPDGPVGRSMLWIAEHLRIFSNAGEGLVRQIKHNVRGAGGHWAYLLGEVRRSFWYYFPVALSMKLSVPLLVAPLALAAIKPRALVNWATVAAAALLLCSLTFRVQIGVRFVLPLVALAAVGLSAALVQTCQENRSAATRRALAAAAVVGVLSTALAAARVWPNALCYTNALWGGTEHGYRLLSDSNYDWGQGVLQLARWQQAHQPATVDVWYFGTDPRVEAPPIRVVPLHRLPIVQPADVLAQVRGDYLAVSTTLLYGTTMSDAHRAAATFFRGLTPADRTMTFLIYDRTQIEVRSRKAPE